MTDVLWSGQTVRVCGVMMSETDRVFVCLFVCLFVVEARLRCSLWTRQETLNVRRLETEESLVGLRHRLDQLDSLLTHTQM